MQRQQYLTEAKDIFVTPREQRSLAEEDQQSTQIHQACKRFWRVYWFGQLLCKPVGYVIASIFGQLMLCQALIERLPEHSLIRGIAARVAVLWVIFVTAFQLALVPDPTVRRTAIVIGNLTSAAFGIALLVAKHSHAPLWWMQCFLIVATVLAAQLVISEIYAARWKKEQKKLPVPFWLR